jgi:sodium transport system ATP-binding protein
MEFIEEARTQGKTVVYCTHIMSEVERLCDQVYVIHDGRIRGEGAVADLKSRTGAATLEMAFLELVQPKGAHLSEEPISSPV